MASADPRKASFQVHEDVAKASKSLYQVIVDSIEDLILLTAEEKSTWRRIASKLEHRKKKTDVDTVLQHLSEKTEAFKRAISVARDQAIQRTDIAARYTAMRTTMVHHDITENHKKVHDRIYSLERKNSDLKATIKAESRETAEKYAEMYEQNLKKVLAKAEARARRQDEQVVAYKNEMMAVVLESSMDLEYVLMYRGNMKTRASSQAQTLLRQDRLLTWMNQANPDLILVNANIRSAGEGKISAMSILCADLVGCLATARPEDVIIHFFCGLHSDYDEEQFPGPAGLVRSLIIQVFLKLVSRNHLNLDFLHDRNMVEALRAHNIKAMCYTLHELLHGFPAGTRVFCIIDSISALDSFDAFRDLQVVLQRLRDIVDDRDLRAFFKVLMANSSTCSMDMQCQPVFEERPDRVVNLSSGGLMPGGVVY
ncbi:hypothetical protein SLS63_003543 [Diaporthe eres]|uniref:Uncharacterized protein n=1 Tax=Diaporthe eres TaxID=83184 RepID=A0ABR1PGH8_DIAER